MILDLFGLLGSTIVLPEKKFNAFMALVGCGPAYVFHFMDALAEAGVTMGFTRQAVSYTHLDPSGVNFIRGGAKARPSGVAQGTHAE